MRLTTRGRYAVTAMLDLAMHDADGPVCLADVARRQAISLPYLEQLFTRLRRAELVASTRGPGGGYRLGRGAERISVADVVVAVNEPIAATRCGGMRDCQDGSTCLTHELWDELGTHLQRFLDQTTLAGLAARQSVRQIAARQDGRPTPVPMPARHAAR